MLGVSGERLREAVDGACCAMQCRMAGIHDPIWYWGVVVGSLLFVGCTRELTGLMDIPSVLLVCACRRCDRDGASAVEVYL